MALEAGLVVVWCSVAPCFRKLVAPVDVGRDQFPEDEAMSAHHARLEEGAYAGVTTVAAIDLVIEDLGSRNGTFIDGRRLEGRDFAERSAVVRMAHTVGVVVPDVASYERGVVPALGRPPPEWSQYLDYAEIAHVADQAARSSGIHMHASGVAWCLCQFWNSRDKLAGVITEAAKTAGTDLLRDSHLGKPGRRKFLI